MSNSITSCTESFFSKFYIENPTTKKIGEIITVAIGVIAMLAVVGGLGIHYGGLQPGALKPLQLFVGGGIVGPLAIFFAYCIGKGESIYSVKTFDEFREALGGTNDTGNVIDDPEDLDYVQDGLKDLEHHKAFTHKNHETAKAEFSKTMDLFKWGDVDYPCSGEIEDLESLENQELNTSLFHFSATNGVQGDIPRSSKDTKNIHVYQVASQYNAAEAPNPGTPPIGEAMDSSKNDKTQGPLAQRTNPAVFELVTAFLTHLGFNMLEHVLPSAGKTYQKGPIQHGYLCPDSTNIELLTEEFKANYSKAEYVCYPSQSSCWNGAEQPVYLLLQAAPAIGYANLGGANTDELQKYAALANYLALFRQGVALAEEQEKEQPVVLHATAVGGGVFGNSQDNLLWGFKMAALAMQEEMAQVNVHVQLESYQGKRDEAIGHIAQELKIPNGDRIGDSQQ
ncbi:MAG: hypothetical protein K940chlam9_01063 [Chlamydiae bacterium]|nr:hypothetical protein [Chlamydiota bacterium]